jgi:uncharacterized protein YukE
MLAMMEEEMVRESRKRYRAGTGRVTMQWHRGRKQTGFLQEMWSGAAAGMALTCNLLHLSPAISYGLS